MSSGAKVLSAFIRETTPGITPAGVWNLFKRTSWGVGPSQNTNDNDEIGGTRMAQGATLGTVDVGGDVGATASMMTSWLRVLARSGRVIC